MNLTIIKINPQKIKITMKKSNEKDKKKLYFKNIYSFLTNHGKNSIRMHYLLRAYCSL